MEAVLANLDSYWAGFKVTLELLIVGGLGAMVIGIIIALMRISPIGSLRAIATGWTEIMRNTPLTLIFFFIIVIIFIVVIIVTIPSTPTSITSIIINTT